MPNPEANQKAAIHNCQIFAHLQGEHQTHSHPSAKSSITFYLELFHLKAVTIFMLHILQVK
jgi:hypothetical protein